MEGAPHTAKQSTCASMGCPLPVYKGVEEGKAGPLYGAPKGGSPTPSRSRFRPFPSWSRRRWKRERGRRKGGQPPPNWDWAWGRRTSWPSPLSSTKAHVGPLSPRGLSVTSWYSGKCPNSSETISVSKHNLPIYQSSCLDHSETPRHVRDHIRDTELPSVHQNT